MSDHRELEKLAKAAPFGPWKYWGETANEIFQSTTGRRVLIIAHDQSRSACRFIAAANPAAVLGLIAESRIQVAKIAEVELERDQLKTDNTALVAGIERQCNWLQSLIDIGGKADADTMGAMLAKLRHELAMNKVYARG